MYEVDPSEVVIKNRLKPGRMLLVDTQEKSVIQDIELKQQIAKSRPHSDWLKEQVIALITIPHTLNLSYIINLI